MQPERLGPYQIIRQLGKGGMGTVYEGCHVDSGRRVAVKVLKPELAATEGFRHRFESEIESLKKLHHAAIVRLYGYGEQDGCLYYSMELVDGITLEHQLRAGYRFDWHAVTRIGIQVSKALKHAHDHGVIHRDIKPANLLVDASGEVRLLDFGIARIFGGNQLTAAGGVLGTAEYMSPEQAGGKPLDHRCDQYSLGCVLYALLAGRPPFRASGMAELLQLQRFAEPEPVRTFAPAAPEELERIIIQLLEKEPVNRFRNTLVLARRLEAMDRALGRVSPEHEEVADDPIRDPQAADREEVAETWPASQWRKEPVGPDESVCDSNAAVPLSPPAPVHAPAPMPVEENHFTLIEEAERRDRLRARESRLQSVGQGLFLLAGLTLLAAIVWYFARSRSADAIDAEITAVVAAVGTDGLPQVEDAIDEFLARFPDDPRARKMAHYQAEVRLLRVDRRLQSRARHGQGTAALTPAEQIYVAALRLAETDPDKAMHHLEALIDLHGGIRPTAPPGQRRPVPVPARDAGVEARLLTLAERRRASLQQQIEGAARAHRRALEERLRHANQVRGTDPDRSKRIWQGIVRLYSDKPWATDLVARARSELATTGEQSTAAASE